MKRYVKVPEGEPGLAAVPPKVPSPSKEDLELDSMITTYMRMLYRQTYLLYKDSSDRFSKDDSMILRENLKLLLELQDRERKYLLSLSEDELDKLAKTE